MERIIREAIKTGTILEINAFPVRLDLKDEHIRMAVNLGAKFSIDYILAKCERLKDTDLKWKALHKALRREGTGPRYKGHYVDCGPELSRMKERDQMFTYDISKGGMLTGSGNISTGERFFSDAGWGSCATCRPT